MEKTSDNKYVIGITHGDINGIGYEVIFKALSDPDIYKNCTIVIYGSPKIAAFHRKQINLSNITVNNAASENELVPNAINIINVCDENTRVELGNNTIIAGECCIAAMHKAQSAVKAGLLDILISGPFNQYNVSEAGFRFSGLPESIAQDLGCKNFINIFCGQNIKIASVTSPMPLSAVPQSLNIDKIIWKLKTLNKVLHDDFTIRKPQIAVLGINPFASDYGVYGQEERNIIHPAIVKASEEGLVVFGPYNADGFFATEAYKKFDAVLTMTYDQALIPFRIIEKFQGVCYSAGLPTICTAPTHGPAYDIAGKGIANESSLRNAIYLAEDIFRNRKILEGIVPIKRQVEPEADKKIC